MQGYVARKGDRYYAVIYEGIDPLTGRERRRWHPAGTDRAVAETLACDLAERRRRDGGHERGSLTVAVYLTQRWLPSKQMALRPSTWDAYRRVIDLHVVPRIGRVPLRHLRPDHLERLYADLLDDGRADGAGGLNNKTVVEIHMILRRALGRRRATRLDPHQPGQDRPCPQAATVVEQHVACLERPPTRRLPRLDP